MSTCLTTCVICYGKLDPPQNENSTEDELKEVDDRNKTIVQNFCTQFHIGLDHFPAFHWNFRCEPLPFCVDCQETVRNLNVLHEQVETAQKSINFLKNSIKTTILERGSGFVQDGVIDGRIKMIREFIIAGTHSMMPPQLTIQSGPCTESAVTTTATTTFDPAAIQPSLLPLDEIQGLHYAELSSHLQHRHNNNNNNNNLNELNILNNDHNNRQVSESEISSSEDDDDLDTASVLNATSMAGSQKTINSNIMMNEEESSDDEWPIRKEQVKAVKLPEADLWSYSGYIFRGSNENGFKCACCPHPTTYKARCDIIRHMRLRHLKNARTHLCSTCGMKFFRPARLRRHLRNVHNINTDERTAVYRASVGIQASDQYSPISEVNSPIFHEPQSVLFCELCHAKFNKLQDLQLHRKQFHPIPPPGRAPKYRRPSLMSSKRSHHISRPFQRGHHFSRPPSSERGHYSRPSSPARSHRSLQSWQAPPPAAARGHFPPPPLSDRDHHCSRPSSPIRGHHFPFPPSSTKQRNNFSHASSERTHLVSRPTSPLRDQQQQQHHYDHPDVSSPANIYNPPSGHGITGQVIGVTGQSASIQASDQCWPLSMSIPTTATITTQNSIMVLNNQDNNNPFFDGRCQICNTQFPTDLQLQLHRIRAHTPPPIETIHYPIPPFISIDAIHPLIFECQYCDCMFKLKENFVKHVQQFHSDTTTTTNNENSNQNINEQLNLLSETNDASNNNSNCNQLRSETPKIIISSSNNNVATMKESDNSVNNLIKIPCPTCGQEFENTVRLRRHMRKVHDVGRWTFGQPSVSVFGCHSSAAENSIGDQTSLCSPISKSSSNSIVDVSPQCDLSCDHLGQEKLASDEDLQASTQQICHPSPPPLDKITSPSSPFRCVYCESDFIFQENLIKHVREFHSSPRSAKDNDEDSFEEANLKSIQSNNSSSNNNNNNDNFMNLSQSPKNCRPRRPFDCPHCTEKFGQDILMTRHVVQVHKQPHSPISSSFASVSSSSTPSSVATATTAELKPELFEIHICEKCGKTYATGRSLRNHEIATHKFDPSSPPKQKRKRSTIVDQNLEETVACRSQKSDDDDQINAAGGGGGSRSRKQNKENTLQDCAKINCVQKSTMDSTDIDGKENYDLCETRSPTIKYKRWGIRPCWIQLDGIIGPQI